MLPNGGEQDSTIASYLPYVLRKTNGRWVSHLLGDAPNCAFHVVDDITVFFFKQKLQSLLARAHPFFLKKKRHGACVNSDAKC